MEAGNLFELGTSLDVSGDNLSGVGSTESVFLNFILWVVRIEVVAQA